MSQKSEFVAIKRHGTAHSTYHTPHVYLVHDTTHHTVPGTSHNAPPSYSCLVLHIAPSRLHIEKYQEARRYNSIAFAQESSSRKSSTVWRKRVALYRLVHALLHSLHLTFYLNTYIYMYSQVHVYTHTYTYMYTYICTCTCANIYVDTFVYGKSIYICRYFGLWICIYKCIHI